LLTIASFVDLNNLRPVFSHGDACWAIISNTDLSKTKEITVGGPAIGGAAHLAALQIGKKYNVPVRLIPFKSNFDAVVNMAGGNGVTFGLDTTEAFENFRVKNPRLRIVGVSCGKRLPDYPQIKTLREQGIVAPSVINIVVANVAMPADKRQRISQILEQATKQIGETEIRKMSGFNPPQFDRITAQEHFTKSIKLISNLRDQFKKEIIQSQ
jgi:tripartite-type tricarboxylate transporter receptor subunit TctC